MIDETNDRNPFRCFRGQFLRGAILVALAIVILAYLGILSLIPYLTKKDDPDIYWHAKNGFVLFLAELIWVAIRIMLIFVRVPGLGCGMAAIGCVVSLGFLAISIICIIKALNGERFRIPLITDFAEKM